MVSVQNLNLQKKTHVNSSSKNRILNGIAESPKPKPSSLSKIKLVAKELKFAKLIAGNDPKLSEKQLNKFKKWIKLRANSLHPFENEDFLRIWKGLFYCMWMSDKPLNQEKLGEDLASLLHCFDDSTVRVRFFGMFLHTMNAEWFGIDQWRIDKFMMLVRRVTRQILITISNQNNNKKVIQMFGSQLERKVLQQNVSVGFFMHFTEIFLEEVAKVIHENASPIIVELIRPFANYIAKSKNMKLSKYVMKHVFHFLLYQSDLGREYQEKFEAWKQMGFPGLSINDIEMTEEQIELDDDEEMAANANEGTQLDPRAGRVDVLMPEIKFDAKEIAKLFEELVQLEITNVKSRKMMRKLIRQYSLFSIGKFPLGIRKMEVNAKNVNLPHIQDKVNELVQFEKKLLDKTRDLKKMSKRKRRHALKTVDENSKKIKKPNRKMPKPRILTKEEKVKVNSWQEDDIPEILINKETSSAKMCPVAERNTSEKPANGISNPDTDIAYKQNFVLNPVALKGKRKLANKISTTTSAPVTPASTTKKVKIMLKLNQSQDTNDYMRQIRSSPNLPYDSTKKPSKSLLKPNLLPSPINPYYKKKIGLNI